MDDYNIFSHCHMNPFDGSDQFLSHNIASALQGHNLQQTLSCESYSYQTCNSPADEINNFERPTNQVKTTSLNSSVAQQFSRNLPLLVLHLILRTLTTQSFPAISDTTQFYGFDCSPKPTKNEVASSQFGNVDMQFSALSSKGSSENQNYEPKISQGIKWSSSSPRTSGHTSDHILAQRKRREKGPLHLRKKMDKVSVLGVAIKHAKELQERLKMPEGQTEKRTVELVAFVKKSQLSSDDDNSEGEGVTGESLPEVEARIECQKKDVLLRIHCQKQKGISVYCHLETPIST
ncbi:hypothetical protein L6164_027968 [Bauhinia variegata]|uniref:Uncharacterized protein n=1 Tax=Bauhinia variegata TaxID=167791 RepID=A0ACB9LW61_BAUVA|nr:hypothetical protein L6164_027968 [Bauhinia variegata]